MRPIYILCVLVIALVAAIGLGACDASAATAAAAVCLGAILAPAVKDELLSVAKTLPNGAATTISDGIDLGLTSRARFTGGCELLIEAPALVVGDLADAATMKYEVFHAMAADFSDEVSLYGTPQLTQTGAGGAGAAAATKRVGLPSDVKRYVRVKATNSGAGDASDKSFTASLVF